MSDFSLIGGGSECLESGLDLSATNGTLITSGGSANTVGAFVELLSAANNTKASNFISIIIGDNAGASQEPILLNIAIGGAGSEVIIIPNLFARSITGGNKTHYQYYFPLEIPADVRISADSQSSSASTQTRVSIYRCFGALSQQSALSVIDSIGATTASSRGTEVPRGSSINTFGVWTTITASLAQSIKGFSVCAQRANTSWSDATVIYEVGIGSAGNEEIIFSGQIVRMATSEEGFGVVSPFIPVGIVNGTRISIREQTTLDDADTDLDYIIYGVR